MKFWWVLFLSSLLGLIVVAYGIVHSKPPVVVVNPNLYGDWTVK